MIKIKNIDKNLIGYIIGVAILLFLFIFLVSCSWIGYSVKRECQIAQAKYSEDCVPALMSLLANESDQTGKNAAIWALGQLGDKQALPLLESYYNSYEKKQERGNWQIGISQYELKKAIKLLRSDFNISAFIWRD